MLQPEVIPAAEMSSMRGPSTRLRATVGWDVVLIPANWQIMVHQPRDGEPQAWVVPDPIFVRHQPGVAGVAEKRIQDPKYGRMKIGDPTKVLEAWRTRGGIVVPRDYPCSAFGQKFAGFCVRWPGVNGWHHTWAYERPPMGGRGPQVDTLAQCKLYAGWGLDLLGGCPEHILDGIRARHQRRLDMLEGRYDKPGTTVQQIRALQMRMRAMGWLPREDNTIRANIGSLDRQADAAKSGAVPPHVAAYLQTLTPEQRAAVAGLSAPATPAPDTLPALELDAAKPDTDGTVTL